MISRAWHARQTARARDCRASATLGRCLVPHDGARTFISLNRRRCRRQSTVVNTLAPFLPLVAMTVATIAVVGSPRSQAADGGAGGLDHRPDAGAQKSPFRPIGPAGAFLGPLPSAPGMESPGGSDPERRYPLKRRANGVLLYEAPQFSAVVAPDGTVTFHDRRLEYSAPKSAFSFDLSDDFVREFTRGTLYPYEKANFLAATFERRTGMAAKWYGKQMHAAQEDLPHRLDALWADTRYRRRERRRIIFLLWEDVNISAADARPAATIIEGWIRKRLPRGSPDAYSDDELDALSRELGGGRAFRPYGSPLEMRWPSQ